MASQDAWSDFETLRHNLKLYKVEQLKQIVNGFNEECYTNLTKTGKKQDLIDKIGREIEDWRRNNFVDRWLKGKDIMIRHRQTATSNAHRANGEFSYTHNYVPPTTAATYQQGSSVSGTIPRYDPYAPPRRSTQPAPVISSSPSSAPAPQLPTPTIRFKYSPFFKMERLVSSVVECPESASSMDRRSQSLSFAMIPEILSKLNSTSQKYQLRLYCTSSTYYTPPGAFRSPVATPCPIEFPPTCEVRVNGTQLGANLKGLKKKPGTAPPPDLGKLVRMSPNASNRIEMIYVNSQQPTPLKKYYLVVMLVEVTSVDQLIDRLRKGKYESKAGVLAQMNKAISDDDDIVAGHQKMSLKCPLSFMRIATPCRGSTCVHPQCFDALSWFSVMEQTTTWMCPVCEKVLNVDDLFIDGYFDNILHETPDSVEDIIVEADGQWHTEDNKYGSPEWKASHPVAAPSKPTAKQELPPAKPAANGINNADKPRPRDTEIVILDTDDEDEDEGRVKRELSPSTDGAFSRASRSVAGSQSRHSQATDIIDLTLDSDDDNSPSQPSAPLMKKRKETEDLPSPTEQIWKKSRTDNGPSSSFTALVNNSTLRMAEEASAARRMAPIPSSSTRYPPSQQSPYRGSGSQSYDLPGSLTLPPASLPRRPSSSNRDNFRNTLPPLSYGSQQHSSGAGSSSPQPWR